jgi:hypothetical protein
MSHVRSLKCDRKIVRIKHYCKKWKWPRGAGQAALRTILTLIGLAMGVGSSSGDLQL